MLPTMASIAFCFASASKRLFRAMLRTILTTDVPRRNLGLGLSLASALLSASYLLPLKHATQLAPADDVVLALLFCAALFNTVSFVAKAFRHGMPLRSEAEGFVSPTSALLSVFTVFGNFAAGRTIALLHPAVTSVLMQTQVLFVVVAAYFWLGERVNLAFIVGSVLSLSGVGLMQWRADGASLDVLAGTAWGLCAALSFGLMQVLTRKVALRIDPLRFNAERLWLSVLWLSLMPGRLSSALDMSWHTLLLAALGAFFGPFLGRVALIYAARHVDAALTSLVGVLAPVFALGLTLVLFGDAPSTNELWGGAIVVAGTALALRARA